MSLLRENALIEDRKASVLIRLGAGVLGFLARVPAALLAAFQDENTRATKKAVEDEDKDIFERLPDPPHLHYGEVKYTDGKYRYFD